MFDPFADVEETPVENSQASPGTSPVGDGAPVVVNNIEGKVSVTVKGGAGFDAPWIVVRADNVDEALGHIYTDKFRELMDVARKATAYFSKNTGSANSQQGGKPEGQPEGAAQHPEGERQYCEHGEMRYLSGFSQRTNKTYEMFVCPLDRKDPNCCKPKSPSKRS